VERAFRAYKTIDLKVRPIHHRLEPRVRAHIFLCMLAYYVQWHMIEAWRPLLFGDEDQQAKQTRDPVAPAKRSSAALAKVASHQLDAFLLLDMESILRWSERVPLRRHLERRTTVSMSPGGTAARCSGPQQRAVAIPRPPQPMISRRHLNVGGSCASHSQDTSIQNPGTTLESNRPCASVLTA
jgi:hypothetical protein